MIIRHNAVLDWLTDEHLLAEAAKGEGQLIRSRALLCAPPEYRQGVEARVVELSSRVVDTPHGRVSVCWADSMDVRTVALQELRAQGVELLTPTI